MAVATTFGGTVTKYPIGISGNQEKWVYDAGTHASGDVTQNASSGVIIPCRGISGKISEISFEETGSTDVDFMLAEKDPSADGSTLVATEEEVILFLEGVNLGYSPELARPICFTSRATPKAPYLYIKLTEGNVAAVTTWKLSITYDRT